MNTPNFWLDIWKNVIANLLAAIISIGFAIIIYWLYIAYRRLRPLLQFFGITRNCSELSIICSQIVIRGAPAPSHARVGTRGPVVSLLELHAAHALRRHLSGQPFAYLPEGMQEWLHKQLPTWTPLVPCIDAATIDEQQINRFKNNECPFAEAFPTNTVLIGSSIYNSLVEVLEARNLMEARFDRDENQLRCFKNRNGRRLEPARELKLNDRNEFEIDEYGDRKLDENKSAEGAIIQRIEKDGRTVIVCSGLSSNATFNAVNYLISNWSNACRLPPTGNFIRYLAWYGLPLEKEEIRKPSVICEMPADEKESWLMLEAPLTNQVINIRSADS